MQNGENKRIGNRTIKVHYDRVELSLKFRNKIFPVPLSKLSHHYFRLGVFDAQVDIALRNANEQYVHNQQISEL